MTPELKRACELVFQEHKNSAQPLMWNKDIFGKRLTWGLREMAKETLLQKKVIYFPNAPKKIITALNPRASQATHFEEAIEMVRSTTPVVQVVHTNNNAAAFIPAKPERSIYKLQSGFEKPMQNTLELKWYHRPLYSYIVLPAVAATLGASIAFLLSHLPVWL